MLWIKLHQWLPHSVNALGEDFRPSCFASLFKKATDSIGSLQNRPRHAFKRPNLIVPVKENFPAFTINPNQDLADNHFFSLLLNLLSHCTT
jgi:hypothetical protein